MVDDEFTTDAVEGEVSQAVAAYKVALEKTVYRNWEHRLALLAGVPDAIKSESLLKATREYAMSVVNKSPAHRQAFEKLAKSLPPLVAHKDDFQSLIIDSSNT